LTDGSSGYFLKGQGVGVDPVYALLTAGDIPNLDASKITSGTFDVTRIPSLDASKITTGTFDLARIPRLDLTKMPLGTSGYFLKGQGASDPIYALLTSADIPSLDASKITTGTFDVARIPGLDASKIVSGRFPVSRLPDGSSGYVLVGQGSGYDLAWKDISGIAGVITDSQHGTRTGIPFAHHGDWGHYGKIPTSAPTGAAERAYVDSTNLYVHDGTSWILRATKDWNSLINKPSTFPPSAHTHSRSDVTDFWSSPFWNNIPDKPSTFPPSAHASSHEYGGSDLVRNLDYLAIRGTTVVDSGRKLVGVTSVGQSLNPDADNSRALGSGSFRYAGFVAVNGYVDNLYSSAGGAPNFPAGIAVNGMIIISSAALLQNLVGVNQNLYPYYDNTYWLGLSAYRWAGFYAVNKYAAFKHPLHNPERYIVFKCTESPKVTVEDWGIAELKDGKAFVGLSEEFIALMSDKAEYAVFLTPEGECNGLYVSKKEFYGFEVRELNNGKSNIRFSWQVKAVRIGDEETPVLEEPTPQFTDQEKDKQLEWMKNRQEAGKLKEEDRLNRMKQKIAKYREATGKTSLAPHA
jgi:hypothetical protein